MNLDDLFEQAVSAHRSGFADAEVLAVKEFRAALSVQLLNAETAIGNAICVIGHQMRTPIAPPTTDHISYQIALSCDFDRCRFVAKHLLERGNINEAITLIRRLTETLARLKETETFLLAELVGKTPNIKHSLGPASYMYSGLSKIAHASDPGIMDFLKVSEQGNSRGPSPYPRFHPVAINYFQLFLYLCLSYVVQMARFFDNWYPDADMTLLKMAMIDMLLKSLEADLIDEAVA